MVLPTVVLFDQSGIYKEPFSFSLTGNAQLNGIGFKRKRSDPRCFCHPWHLDSGNPCRNGEVGL